MKKNSLKKNFIFNLIIQIVNLAVPLITTPYLARTLGEIGNGQYSYAYSIATYFVVFANLGFNVYGQREIAKTRDEKYEKSKVFFEILILKSIFSIISFIVLLSTVLLIGYGESYDILLLIMSGLVIFSIFDITYYMNGTEDFKGLAIRNIIVKIISLILIFIFVKKQSDVWIYTLCIVFSQVFGFLVMWSGLKNNISKVSLKELKLSKHLKPSLLIFLPTLATVVYSVFDKTMIGLLSPNPDYDNGCYEQAYKINSTALIFTTIITTIMAPRNANDYSKNNYEAINNHINFSISYVLCLSLPLITAFIILSGNLSLWFLGDGYNEVPILLAIMSTRFLVSGLGVIIAEQIFVIRGEEKYCTFATSIAALINVLFNLFLIPILGSIGAAIATAVTEIFSCTILMIVAKKKKYINIGQFKNTWKYIISSVIMAIPVYFININMEHSILSFGICTLVGLITYGITLIILHDEFTLNILSLIINIIKNKLHRGEKKDV